MSSGGFRTAAAKAFHAFSPPLLVRSHGRKLGTSPFTLAPIFSLLS